jgi:hypothetical protein
VAVGMFSPSEDVLSFFSACVCQPSDWHLARGVGVNESTAVLIDFDFALGHYIGTIVGTGAAYWLTPTEAPTRCQPNRQLHFAQVQCVRTPVGAKFDLTAWQPVEGPLISTYMLTAADGNVTSSSGSVY